MNRPTTVNPLHLIDKQVADKIMGQKYTPDFRPTSYLLHAWQVVTRMAELGYFGFINIDPTDNMFMASFSDMKFDQDDGTDIFADIGPSVCVSICKAALQAFEEDSDAQ